MNVALDPLDLHYSVTWLRPEPYTMPGHIGLTLDAAANRLSRLPPDNRGRVLLEAAKEAVEADLKKLTAPSVRVVFIGNVGNGKTTAICILTNLTRSEGLC